MASIYKRGPYQWQVLIRRKGYPSQSKVFETKPEAEAWAAKIESEMATGSFVSRKESESTTLAEALDRYEREVSSGKKGHAKEKYAIDHWRQSPLASRFLASIRSSDLSKWRDERLKDVSASTVNRLLNLLSHVFTVAAQDWGMGGIFNPVQNVRRPRNPPHRERRLIDGELEKILASTKSKSLADVILLALETGMRRGEIARMRWDHLDLKKKVLLIPDTKTLTPRRIGLSDEVVHMLKRLPRRLDGKVWGYDDNGLGITRVFQEALKRARKSYVKEFEERHQEEKNAEPDSAFLVNLTFHDLRHEATSRLFELGAKTELVKATTGHKTYTMLARYTHLRPEEMAIEINQLKKLQEKSKLKAPKGTEPNEGGGNHRS